ncbi:hypothetical protein ACP275_04G114400 [Erythranthe tilingii]
MNPHQNNAIDFKRLIHRRISRPYYQSGGMNLRLFKVISGAGERPVVQIQYSGEDKQFSFEEIATMVWASYKRDREAGLGFSVIRNAVAPFEDYFNISHLRATVKTANSAGLHVVGFSFNPVSAARAYNLDNNGRSNVLVYNHGGYALDVSLLVIVEEGFSMISVARDTNLGGEDFTNRLLNYFAAEFTRKYNKDLTAAAASLRRLRAACERAKRVLSTETQATIQIDSLYDGVDFYGSITRNVFESLNMDLFLKGKDTVERCLTVAKIRDKNRVHEVVLIGGTSKIPKLQQLLQDFFDGKYLRMSIDPYLVVRQRVASVRVRFLDFTRMDIGIETGDAGLITVLIPKNTTIPATKERIFFRTDSNSQSTMKIHVFRGVIKEILIPPAPRGAVQFKLRIEIDVYGTLSVWISDRIVMEMKNYSTFLKRRSDAMLTDVKKKLAAKRALLEYAYSMRLACHSDEDHPSSELEKIEIDINEVINWVNANPLAEADAYEHKLAELKDACFLLNPHIWRWS